MKTRFYFLIVLLAAAMAHAQTNNLSSLLQQGLLDEEASHNLNAAIADYQSLATQFDKDRQIAATAIYRLGECYRMLGRTNDAASQYERIVREFSDQQTLATLSLQNLTALGRSEAPNQAAAPSTRLFEDREGRLWSEAPNQAAAPSTAVPDEQDQEIQRLKQMIQNSPDLLNARSEGKHAPLCEAASKGQLRVAEFLLTNGADINLNNGAPLYDAAAAGQNAMVKLLLNHGADVNAGGEKALRTAVIHGFKTVVETLLAYHADINATTQPEPRALRSAIDNDNLDMVQLLLAHGADPNDGFGKPSLFDALPYTNILETLLNAGAKIDQHEPGQIRTWTPLEEAAKDDNPGAVEILLQHGANPNVPDENGDTALHWAARAMGVWGEKVLVHPRSSCLE